MAKVYHVVPAAYDGFSLDYPETEFKSPMDEAKRLGDYYKKNTAGKQIFSTEFFPAGGG